MKEKILITVKTYPVLSKKHMELVCTAGVNEAGEWRRLYPIRFRMLYDEQHYRKYQWVEAELEKSTEDLRPESHKILHHSLRTLGDPLGSANNWSARKLAFLNKVPVYDDLTELIGRAHRNELSLALFRPTRLHGFLHEETEREWDPERLAELEKNRLQSDLFVDQETVAKQFEVVQKLPYKFSYSLEDVAGKKSTMMIEDWEIGALYWNCLKSAAGDEQVAVEKVRQRYWQDFVLRGDIDLTLILGTTKTFHNMKAPNPFIIIGVVYPKVDLQGELF